MLQQANAEPTLLASTSPRCGRQVRSAVGRGGEPPEGDRQPCRSASAPAAARPVSFHRHREQGTIPRRSSRWSRSRRHAVVNNYQSAGRHVHRPTRRGDDPDQPAGHREPGDEPAGPARRFRRWACSRATRRPDRVRVVRRARRQLPADGLEPGAGQESVSTAVSTIRALDRTGTLSIKNAAERRRRSRSAPAEQPDGIAAAINGAVIGVTAQVPRTGDGNLSALLTGNQTGANNGFT